MKLIIYVVSALGQYNNNAMFVITFFSHTNMDLLSGKKY